MVFPEALARTSPVRQALQIHGEDMLLIEVDAWEAE